VRRVADLIRINAQLTDGSSGEHVWTDRFDGTIADTFTLQDSVTGKLIDQLKIWLTPEENAQLARRGTDNPDAHDSYLKGWQLYRQYTPETFAAAIPHLKRAADQDPEFGEAWAALASIYWTAYRKEYSWTSIINPDRANGVSQYGAQDKAQQYLDKALQFPTPLALQINSQLLADYRQHDLALNEASEAVKLDPNDPEGHEALAWTLIFSGQFEKAIESAQIAIQLEPNYPAPHLFAKGTALLMLKQFAEAETALERAIDLTPENKTIQASLAVVYSYLDKHEPAQAAMQQYVERKISASPKIETNLVWWPFMFEADMRLFGEGLVKAGLCCEQTLENYIEGVRLGGTLK